jgi:VIT1/CCC1 family predicted Fe2+/Mn2+ transporter
MCGYNPQVLHQGPIPRFLHSIFEYLAGVFLVVAPFLLDFKGGSIAVSIVAGVLVIFLAAVSDAPLGLVPQVPAGAHAVLDLLLSALFIAAPFIFGFSNQGAPTAVFIAGGVVSLLISVGTRYLKEEETLRSRRRLRRGRKRGRERAEGDALIEPPEFDPSPPREES